MDSGEWSGKWRARQYSNLPPFAPEAVGLSILATDACILGTMKTHRTRRSIAGVDQDHKSSTRRRSAARAYSEIEASEEGPRRRDLHVKIVRAKRIAFHPTFPMRPAR